MKLKRGTKVKVKDGLIVDDFYNGLRFHNGMKRHKGQVAIIEGSPHYNENFYQINIDVEGYDWSKGMLEVVS